MIVTSDGYGRTNKHVIEDANSVQIILDDGTTYDDVKLVGTDPLNDVAFLKINNVSGTIRVEGEFSDVDAETVSGDITLGLAIVPDRIAVDSVSGNITVSLPESASFTAQLDTVSGSLMCALPGTFGEDKVVVGDGKANYHFSTVSGNLNIEKN